MKLHYSIQHYRRVWVWESADGGFYVFASFVVDRRNHGNHEVSVHDEFADADRDAETLRAQIKGYRRLTGGADQPKPISP